MIDFSKAPCIYWSKTTKISYLQRRIIVWSIMYYENDESCVPDYVYDSVSRQLADLYKEATQDELEKSTYYYAMFDFNGSTGYDIPHRLTNKDREYLGHIAKVAYNSWKQMEGKQ